MHRKPAVAVRVIGVAVAVAGACLPLASSAAGVYAYPQAGQSQEQHTLTRAKPTPVTANNSLVIQNVGNCGIARQAMPINASAASIVRLKPSRTMKDAIRNEVRAMDKSLYASSIAADDSVTP